MFSLKKLFKKSRHKSIKKPLGDEDLYSLDSQQLKDLIEKNISFDFFQLGSLNPSDKPILPQAKIKSQEEIMSQLKSTPLNRPIVLVCPNGKLSRAFSATLRDKGFINVYFVKQGFSSLS